MKTLCNERFEEEKMEKRAKQKKKKRAEIIEIKWTISGLL